MKIEIIKDITISPFEFKKGDIVEELKLKKINTGIMLQEEYNETEDYLFDIIDFLIKTKHAKIIQENYFVCDFIKNLKISTSLICGICDSSDKKECKFCIFDKITQDKHLEIIDYINKGFPEYINEIIATYYINEKTLENGTQSGI